MSLRPRRPFRKPFKGPPKAGAPVPKPAAQAQPAPLAKCAKCQADLDGGATFCGQCGAPVRVGIKPKRTMVEVRRNLQKGRNLRTIRSGANTLLLLAALNIAGGFIVYLVFKDKCDKLLQMDTAAVREMIAAEGGNLADFERGIWAARHFGALCFAEYGLPGLIFLGLYAWARVSPLPATVAGLITYITVMVAGLAINPASLLSPVGWVIRLAILGALGSAIQSASAERRIREKELARKQAEELAKRRAALAQGEAEPEVAEESPG